MGGPRTSAFGEPAGDADDGGAARHSRARMAAALLLLVLLAVPFHARTIAELRAGAYSAPDADLVLLHRTFRRVDGLAYEEPPLRRFLSGEPSYILRRYFVYTVDSMGYVEVAEMLCTGQLDPLLHRVLFATYPLVAAPFYCPTRAVMSMVVPNLLLMAGSFALVWRILGRLGLGASARWLVLGWMVLSPVPEQAFAVMSEATNLFFYLLTVELFLAHWSEGGRAGPSLLASSTLFVLGRPNNVLLYLSLVVFGWLRGRPPDRRLLLPPLALVPLVPAAVFNEPLIDRHMLGDCEAEGNCLSVQLRQSLGEIGASAALGRFLPTGVAQGLRSDPLPVLLVALAVAARSGLRRALVDGPRALLLFELAAVALYTPLVGHHTTYRHVIYATPLLMALVAGELEGPQQERARASGASDSRNTPPPTPSSEATERSSSASSGAGEST